MNNFSILSKTCYNLTKLRFLTLCDYCKINLLITTRRRISTQFVDSSSKSRLNYKVVFLGSDNFSIPSLITLTDLLGQENVSVVVSNFGNVVGKYAKKNDLRTFSWDEYKTGDFRHEGDQDFGVVASFGYLIPQRVIQRFPLGILNVHGSLLPRWRGAAPIPHAIMSGDTKTGISIMQVAPHRFDVGPVLYRQEIPLDPHIRRPELITIMADVGAEALRHVLSDLDNFLKSPIIQNEEDVKLSPKLVPEMALVDWKSQTALEIYNLFRGLYGVFKLKTYFMDKSVDLDEIGLVAGSNGSNSSRNTNNDSSSIRICDKSALDKNSRVFNVGTNFERFYSDNSPIYNLEDDKCLPSKALPGHIIFIKDILLVKCSGSVRVPSSGSNSQKYASYISLRKIKVGNKWMSAKDFQNGFLSKCKHDQRLFSFKRISPSQTNEVICPPSELAIKQNKINHWKS